MRGFFITHLSESTGLSAGKHPCRYWIFLILELLVVYGKGIQHREKMCISWIGEKHKVASISHMHTQIWPYCVCKCGICSCSLSCHRLLTPSMGLGCHVPFGNPYRFYGNRQAVRGIKTKGKQDAQRGFGMHGGMEASSPMDASPKMLGQTKPQGCSH